VISTSSPPVFVRFLLGVGGTLLCSVGIAAQSKPVELLGGLAFLTVFCLMLWLAP
jgi:hypothetical protein